jgi:Mn2+/Fe2+ NRAMP family transporter
MSPTVTHESTAHAPVPVGLGTLIGPGLIVAATGIGSGDIVSTTVGGATYGTVLLWAVLVGAFFKFVLTEGIARWQLATRLTAVEGWSLHMPPWVKIYFGIYLTLWTVAVSAALTNACGLAIANLTGGAISVQWGAVLHSLVGCAFVLAGGFSGFERVMKTLVGIMGATMLLCAALTFDNPSQVVQGLLVPTIPAGGRVYVLSLIGGIGGSITLLAYNYWMREEQIEGARYLRYVRADIGVAYLFTAVFGAAVMLIAAQAFLAAQTPISDGQAVPAMAALLGSQLGAFGFYSFSVGFWAAVFASLLGVWQSVPYLFADVYGIMARQSSEVRKTVTTKITSRPYRLALLYITLVPLPFAFVGRPLFIIVAYTVVASLFVPFLALTLLYLNNRVAWSAAVPRNHWTTNVLLIAILALFAMVGFQEVRAAL